LVGIDRGQIRPGIKQKNRLPPVAAEIEYHLLREAFIFRGIQPFEPLFR
jgi:hypothetical protein